MKPAYSMCSWAALTSSAGITVIVAPQVLAGASGAPAPPRDSALVVARLCGIVRIGYGLGEGVGAISDGRAFMRASVILRISIPPVVPAPVVIGWLPAPLLALGLIVLAAALRVRQNLRQFDGAGGAPVHHSSRSVT